MTEHEDLNRPNNGRVVSVRGSVVDAHFPRRLPLIHNLLRTGKDGRIAIEVKTHLNSEIVRGVALTLTQGLARGSLIIDTGQHLNVPVGKRLLGRMFNVFGEPINRKGEIKGGDGVLFIETLRPSISGQPYPKFLKPEMRGSPLLDRNDERCEATQ